MTTAASSASGSHYTVLARRFRPQAFDDVVGQQHVSKALRNAIRAGRVAHAYMFTGARGVGKTSTARILAKALNCPHAVDGVPCNQCEICQGISAGNDVDVMEIDGASNRGIDDIRQLRATVGVRSMRTQFKVYIIDEVHMLTKEAFNALLKTLEEPPPNVKFIFCTTEPNKVPDTILSRCQRFDFSTIAEASIADRLRDIATAEGFTVAEEALELVARRARGSMRDSQSLFDQLLAFSEGTVSAEDVHRMLGTASDERLLELFTAVVNHRPGEVLSLLDVCFSGGVQAGELLDQCIGYVRDLMVVLSGGKQVALASVAETRRDVLLKQGLQLSMPSVMAAFQILSSARSQMFRSTFARTIIEMAMVQLSLLENLSAISELLSGRLPALPDAPAASGLPAATAPAVTVVDAPPAAEKKKNESLTEAYHSNVEQSPVAASADAEPALPGSSQSTTQQTTRPAQTASAAPAAVESSPTAIQAANTATSPLLELSDATLPHIMQHLVKSAGLTTVAGLRMARSLQMAGPSRVEFVLPAGAEFARKALDVAENRGWIEAEILKLTGRTVAIGVRLAAAEAVAPEVDEAPEQTIRTDTPRATQPGNRASNAASARQPSAPAGARREVRREPEEPPQSNLIGEVDPKRDAWVCQAIEIFNANVVRITHAPAARGTSTENP